MFSDSLFYDDFYRKQQNKECCLSIVGKCCTVKHCEIKTLRGYKAHLPTVSHNDHRLKNT